jgi:hypothetical protein
MRLRIGDARRLTSGLLFLTIGGFGMIYGARYRMGSATHMGPGYFPFAVAALIALLGAVSAATSLRTEIGQVEGPEGGRGPIQWHIVPLLCILAGVVAFGLLIEHAGLVLAIAAVVILGCYQRLLTRPLEVLAIGLVLIAIAVALFIHGLGMPWHAFPA